MNILIFSVLLILFPINLLSEKLNLDTLNNYSEFLNFGDKKLNKIKKGRLENELFKYKVDVLGEVFKKNIDILKLNKKLDIVFMVDASSSVGENNFKSELKFVKKLLSDITVDYNHTRVAVITYGSENEVNVNINEISEFSKENNKCLLLNYQLGNITYTGGSTYTLGAFEKAKKILDGSNRNDSKKVLFLITDGFSNGGDPIPISKTLKENQAIIYTIGIQHGNYKELYELSSSPGEFYSYLLDGFEQFEGLARRALHVDLKSGDYVPLGFNEPCDSLCETGDCCDNNALCSCGTTTGHYSCVCRLGYYGSGLKNECYPCTKRTYAEAVNVCLPCPDINHETTIPAIGIESCKCKVGYYQTDDGRCEIVKCPKITIPEHGYLVKKRECGNVVNSACGIRCDIGYSLVGDSIRLCQPNAVWSGIEPKCEVKVCPAIPLPRFASMECSHPDFGKLNETSIELPVDTVCKFKCEVGTRINSKKRTCLPFSLWDGIKTTCRPIKCNKLPQIKYGKYEPESCSLGKQIFGTNCTIVCEKGFSIKGTESKTCGGKFGRWSSGYEDTICEDTTPPNLVCPKNMTTFTVPGKKFGRVAWTPPIVTDNSGLDVSIWMKPVISNITSHKFHIGITAVTYFAQDVFKNKINCTFFVNVTDNEKPTIENCLSPPTFLTTDKDGANITWDEPSIFDNSQKVLILKSHEFGLFKMGITEVNYTAVDAYNNTNTCLLNITIEESSCDIFPDPIYGSSNCSSLDDGLQCIVTCQEGYAIPLTENPNQNNSAVSFICNYTNPIWSNQEGLAFPECSVTKIPDTVKQNGSIEIITNDTDICKNRENLNEINNDLTASLSENLCENNNCTIELNNNCLDPIDKMEEKTNIIKRDLNSFIEVPHRNKRMKKNRMNVKFQVKGKILGGNKIKKNNFYKNSSISLEKPVIICPDGFIPRKLRCVQCPKGTFHNKKTNSCESCSFGGYTDRMGQISCTPCPHNYNTTKIHSKSASHCKEKCNPGTHARRKIIKNYKFSQNRTLERATLKPHCKSCGIGFYQPDYGQLECIKCPEGYTTTGYGSKNVDQCIITAQEICKKYSVCGNGTCNPVNEYQFNCDCFVGFIGNYCEIKTSYCDSKPCLNGGICSTNENTFNCECSQGYTGKYCEEVIEVCNKDCQNNGTCIETESDKFTCICPAGFGGEECDIPIIFCQDNLCENNGQCIEENNTYECICRNGYMGKRCNLLPCDYQPCHENFICINLNTVNTVKEDYKCICPDGYYGQFCNETIDFCQQRPCMNNGTCTSSLTTYQCSCSKLFYGMNCEFKRRTNYILEYPAYDTNNYVKLEGFVENLTEITACFWLKTQDNFNYGTLVSYATRQFDNTFTITDYTGLILYINNEYVVTDIILNDGRWHHICVGWKSLNGTYLVYMDAVKIKSGNKLAPNTHIQGKGNLVIGQEQDILGGRFSQSESFVGKMAYVDIWSTLLSEPEILNHFYSCSENIFGDLYAWPELQYNIYGNIKILNSTFCELCTNPSPLYNGFINITENVAYYSCNKGYEIKNNPYKNGRKCNKASTWEGTHEPYCRKKYCGYPGYVSHAKLIGNQYFYGDVVTFECFEGFTMRGMNSSTCKENGTWYPELPSCLGVQCSFKKPENGSFTVLTEVEYDENNPIFDVGTQIEVNCLENFNLIGQPIITCLDNGNWDFQTPHCIPKQKRKKLDCPLNMIPTPPENGYIDQESFKKAENGDANFVLYKCKSGTDLFGDSTSTCIIDGYWSEINTKCHVDTLFNITLSSFLYQRTRKLVYIRFSGIYSRRKHPVVMVMPCFLLVETDIMMVEKIVPVIHGYSCAFLANKCRRPLIPQNFLIKNEEDDKDDYEIGNKITFHCIEGYELYGNSVIQCSSDRKWTILGQCIKKSCGKPVLNDDAVLEGNSFLFGDSIIIHCPKNISYSQTCGMNGWIGENCN